MWWLLFVPYLLVGVILVYSYVQWTRRKMYAMLATMSSPKALPVIGHAHKFYNSTPEALADTLKYFGSFPSPVCIHMGPLPHVGVFDPESLQVILNSPHCLQKSLQYSFLGISSSIFSSPSDIWKIQRKAFNPAFGPAVLASFVPTFNKKCSLLMGILQQYEGKPEKDFSRDLVKCALDEICETTFGCEFNMQLSSEGDYALDMSEGFVDMVAERCFTIWKYPDFIYRWTKSYRDQVKYVDAFYDTIMGKVERREGIEKIMNDLSNAETSEKSQNFLYCLSKYLSLQGPTSRDDILAHFGLNIVAGLETKARTISSTLFMLAMHPDIQERCYQEIVSVCPAENQFISTEDVGKLTYLEMVIKETMRLFPAAALMARVATSDIKISGNKTIPENTTIIIGTYQIHRDPKIWGPKADQFDPDNFLPENVADRHPYSFIPFSAGPRNCIGLRYAWLSMKILIAYILRRYRLSTSVKYDELRVAYGIFLSIVNGNPMKIERRVV
nr:probable cytochrome P450 313a4 [Aedes albopictus]